MSWRAIVSFHIVTKDSAALVAFYRAIGFGVLHTEEITETEMHLLGIGGRARRQWLAFGPQRVAVEQFEQAGDAYPAATDAASTRFQHLALVTQDAADAWRQAAAAGAAPISRDGAVHLPARSGGVTAVKFRDPEGHPLEFLQFAPGTQAAGGPRIDHSAIVVRDAAASLAFYASRGLIARQGTFNHGPEQTALDGVEDAQAEVVPLMPAAAPPHLELLAYRPPRTPGPPMRPNDVAATRICWRADTAALVRDPDGHLHQTAA